MVGVGGVTRVGQRIRLFLVAKKQVLMQLRLTLSLTLSRSLLQLSPDVAGKGSRAAQPRPQV